MRYRELDISDATVTLYITPVNDPPTVANSSVSSNSSKITVTLSAKDPDGPSSIIITISSYPRYGTLYSLSGVKLGTGQQVHLKSSIKYIKQINTTSVSYFSNKCGSFTDNFSFFAFDGLNFSRTAFVTIQALHGTCTTGYI